MILATCMRLLTGRAQPRPTIRRKVRLRLEVLEARTVPSADAILDWNAAMLEANRIDHTPGGPEPGSGAFEQGGPTRTSRAFAIVAAAMHDALNSVAPAHRAYQVRFRGFEGADPRAAVASAAHDALAALYPEQKPWLDEALANSLAEIEDGPAEDQGVDLGRKVAAAILEARRNDGSNRETVYVPSLRRGRHRPDPLHPDQGFLDPGWGRVKPFAIKKVQNGSLALARGGRIVSFQSPPPPSLNSARYTDAYYEAMMYGGDGITTPTLRSEEQTQVGIFWGYDGTPNLGTPPRLYNQIVRVIAMERGNTMAENARLFALVNLAMADAGIQAWDAKYDYNFWRPIVGIREGDRDGNSFTHGMATWTPLGAPCTNCAGPAPRNFTPPFPAYTSGHATFGAAAFRSVARFYGTDAIPFDFMSDEFNGQNRGSDGQVRPVVVRHFDTLSQAAEENGQSRIYLGIHWSFDKTEGIRAGNRIADYVFQHVVRPLPAGAVPA